MTGRPPIATGVGGTPAEGGPSAADGPSVADGGEIPHVVALIGVGSANAAAARGLVARGHEVVLTDDSDSAPGSALAEELGCGFLFRPDGVRLETALRGVGAFVATPGLPESHPVFAVASALGVPTLSEFDLAAAWDDRDLLAITGTNGKTTVTMLTAAMLDASGIPTAAAGNLEVPLVAAIDDPTPSCFVVEASSFRLARTRRFEPRVACWLNFSPDHLDVHRDLEAYRSAKARIWRDQGPGDTAVYNADDPVVTEALAEVPAAVEQVGFTLLGADRSAQGREGTDLYRREGTDLYRREGTDLYRREGTDLYREERGVLTMPDGTEILETSRLWSHLPHERANVLAAAAIALGAGATPDGVRSGALGFSGLPHRVELVAERDGVRIYNDSKATTPHATLAALGGFDSVVLIAGGRNKGIDLSVLGEASNVVAVVGIGESALQVTSAFSGIPTARVGDMESAVERALDLASPGDTVLLSPGCASFDRYGSYAERGDHFRSVVESLVGSGSGRGEPRAPRPGGGSDG